MRVGDDLRAAIHVNALHTSLAALSWFTVYRTTAYKRLADNIEKTTKKSMLGAVRDDNMAEDKLRGGGAAKSSEKKIKKFDDDLKNYAKDMYVRMFCSFA